MHEVIELYNSGMYQREIAEKFGVSQGMISIRLMNAGIKLRTRNESDKLIWSRKTPEQRAKTLDPAHIAAKGRYRNHAEKCAHAIANQKTPCLSNLEKQFLKVFTDCEIQVIPQYALDIYSIDFALPERKVAIEIDGGSWHNSKVKRGHDTGKEVLLRDRGWVLVRFQVKSLEKRLVITVDFPSQDVSDIIKAVCANPSVFS